MEILFETGTRMWQVPRTDVLELDDAFAIEEDIIQKLRKMKCERIQIVDEGNEFLSHMMDWYDQNPEITHGKKMRVLSKKEMKHYYLVPEKEHGKLSHTTREEEDSTVE